MPDALWQLQWDDDDCRVARVAPTMMCFVNPIPDISTYIYHKALVT